jgi:CRISPR-associated endonuclease Cas1
MNSDDTLYGQIRNGVLTLSGSVTKITVNGGCLCVSDGFLGQSAELRLRRADCPVRRIVVTRPDGFITFAAVKWLHGVGATLVQLDWDGSVLLATTPPSAGDFPALRRFQALAAGSAAGLDIGRRILYAKVSGQSAALDLMKMSDAARVVEKHAAELIVAETEVQMLSIESMAALVYWRAWSPIPVHFARQSVVPSHWATFGARHSIRTNSPRKAATAGNALLNYLYGVIAGEMTIALSGVGLDPGIGIFHTDQPGRNSLVYDLIEGLRPRADFWLASWLGEARFSRRDFYEEADGTIRVTRPLTSHIAITKSLWREPCSLAASWLVKALSGKTRENLAIRVADPPRLVHRPVPLPTSQRVTAPKTCLECGGLLGKGRRKFCCDDCMVSFHAASPTQGRRVVASIAAARASGNDPAHGGTARLRRVETVKGVAVARRAWEAENAWTDQKDREAREWYATTLSPRLATRRNTEIRRACDFSKTYAAKIREGFVPHPMHYPKLAMLVGVPFAEQEWPLPGESLQTVPLI